MGARSRNVCDLVTPRKARFEILPFFAEPLE
jgi:hypothetical protein